MVDYGFWMSECLKNSDMNGFWYWFYKMIEDERNSGKIHA